MKRTISILLTLALMLTLLAAALPAQAAKATATPKPAPTEAPSEEDLAFYKAPKMIIENNEAFTTWLSARACNLYLQFLGAQVEETNFTLGSESFSLPKTQLIKDIPYYLYEDFYATLSAVLVYWDTHEPTNSKAVRSKGVGEMPSHMQAIPNFFIPVNVLTEFFSTEIYPDKKPITIEKDKKVGFISKRAGKKIRRFDIAPMLYFCAEDAEGELSIHALAFLAVLMDSDSNASLGKIKL